MALIVLLALKYFTSFLSATYINKILLFGLY